MNPISIGPELLQSTVLRICDLLDLKRGERELISDEAGLRYELLACVLSSRVLAESAARALERLCVAGLLGDRRWGADDNNFENEVFAELKRTEIEKGWPRGGYRFPRMRARQISELRTILRTKNLRERLDAEFCPRRIRACLVRDLPGVGPKQASMFLRNIGVSYDLAILDVHLIEYFVSISLFPASGVNIAGLQSYEAVEAVVLKYAAALGRCAGLMDWAVWITMRAAREMHA